MITFFNTYISYIRWIVILISFAVVFWSGMHWANQACEVAKGVIAQAEVKETIKTVEKVKYVYIKNAALPPGAASTELLHSWSRD